MKHRSTFSIIGDWYLDTQHEPEHMRQLEEELESRGVTGIKRMFYDYLAASSLWWNVIWWEWVELDEKDVRMGWICNMALFGIIAAILGIYFWVKRDIACGATVALISLLLMHVITTLLGFSLRGGKKKR